MPTNLLSRWLEPTYEPDDFITVTSMSAGPGDAYAVVKCEPNNKPKSKPKSKLKNTKTLPGIKHIQFNEKSGHTAIVWEDDTSTVVRCGENEPFERYVGFCAAVCKKLFGSTSAVKKIIDDKDAKLAKERREAERQRKAKERREEEARNRERRLSKEEKEFVELYNRLMARVPDFENLAKELLNAAGDTDGD